MWAARTQDKRQFFITNPFISDRENDPGRDFLNDFSVTQTGEGAQSDVYTDGTSGPIDGPAAGRKLLPIYMLSFKGKVPGYVPFRRK
jgi:hypothetical protein